MNRVQYLLDSNIFIDAHRRYYGFDICPGFWRALVQCHQRKCVYSIDKVRAELLDQNDQLSQWVRNVAPESFFKGTSDKRVVDAYRDIANWVHKQSQFSAVAKAEFLSVADGWVIAYAKANGLMLVTHEEYAPGARKKVPIPNVCHAHKVEFRGTFEMLRELRIRFILKKKAAS